MVIDPCPIGRKAVKNFGGDIIYYLFLGGESKIEWFFHGSPIGYRENSEYHNGVGGVGL